MTDSDDLPHADILASVRAANPDRMANGMRRQQWDEVLLAHPDVQAMDAGEKTVEEES